MNPKKNSNDLRNGRKVSRVACGIARVAGIRNSAGPMRDRRDRRAGEGRNGVLRGERKASRNEAEG